MSETSSENLLGTYLKDRRTRLDAAAFGFGGSRRRTPGLRREEVAQRANISPTWYTWLEQGRGGAPSADVLDRIAGALMLTDVEREHLFLIGLGRPPEVRYQASEGVSPRLQRVLDALETSPAIIRTAIWDVVAWNRAATLVLTDYSKLPPERRNILRLIFSEPNIRAAQYDWDSVARFVVAAFRADAARAGAVSHVADFVDEMCRAQPRIREAVGRQRRPQLWRGRQASAPSRARPDRVRIFGLFGRRPARSRHGRLQPGDAGGCRAHQKSSRHAYRLTELAASRV